MRASLALATLHSTMVLIMVLLQRGACTSLDSFGRNNTRRHWASSSHKRACCITEQQSSCRRLESAGRAGAAAKAPPTSGRFRMFRGAVEDPAVSIVPSGFTLAQPLPAQDGCATGGLMGIPQYA